MHYIICTLLIIFANVAHALDCNIQKTPYSMDFFGELKGAEKGDILTVMDSDQVICGKFVVTQPGMYGFLHVYGDDPTTIEDEGAVLNDQLTFMLNQKIVSIDDVTWTGDKTKKRLDIKWNTKNEGSNQ